MIITSNHNTDDISIHAPRVGSDCMDYDFINVSTGISIHAPRVGSDKQ